MYDNILNFMNPYYYNFKNAHASYLYSYTTYYANKPPPFKFIAVKTS